MPVTGAFVMPHPPVILPEIGRGREKEIQATIDACRTAAKRIARLKPDVIILSSPHSVLYADYFHISPGAAASGNFRGFGAPGTVIRADYDTAFANELARQAEAQGIPAGTLGERDKTLDHGTMIPLRFINEFYAGYKLVRLGLSGLSFVDHYRFGKCVAETAEKLGRSAVFVASGDMSHKLRDDGPYGFDAAGPRFDKEAAEALANGDFLKLLELDEDMTESAAECGLRSFLIMAGALDGKAVKPERLSYEGPFGVGYGVFAFETTGSDGGRRFDDVYKTAHREKLENVKSDEDDYVKLARLSLETFIKTKKHAAMPGNLPEEMLKQKAGTFVSLKKFGRLRGCIGTIEPVTDCVANEILRNAVSAGTQDPRFPAVTANELGDLVYSVDVLSKAEPVHSVDELDVKRYGVIVSKGYKRGLLLPNLEGVDTPEEQVSIALQKAGIGPNDGYSMERFEVVRHK